MAIAALAAFLVICLIADWALLRRTRVAAASVQVPAQPAASLTLGPAAHAGGFAFLEEMVYHPGHAWALVEGPGRVRLGLDDFAGRLVGPASSVQLPDVGEQVQQGVPAWSLRRGSRTVPMLSPVSGLVVALNANVQADPGLATRDPYGEGWLMVVRPDNLRASLSSLLTGRLVPRWLEEAAARLRALIHGEAGVALLDGGSALADVGALVSDGDWPTIVREFLLTDAGAAAK